ncbi:hypothetical protein [Frateuria sp. YIM B11624]|uniref:hypothetical protein n=1 Tax=Frateuria sp. YIM B11624 TaxID=3143185 RepID=UPI003C750F2E
MTVATEVEPTSIWALYESVAPGDWLQQGDLIRFKEEDRPAYYGVVVTADCDLGNRKHSRLVTLVPLLSIEEIICKCLAYDAFENYKDALHQYCKRQLSIDDVPLTPAFLGKVKALVREGNISDEVVETAAKAITHEDWVICVPKLRAMFTAAGISWPKALDRFAKQIDSRGDILRLLAPPLTPDRVSVVWLRAMWQARVSDIAIRTSEAQERSGIRVARLNSPFRYRLTQMLGQVFADIGLPDVPAAVLTRDIQEFVR